MRFFLTVVLTALAAAFLARWPASTQSRILGWTFALMTVGLTAVMIALYGKPTRLERIELSDVRWGKRDVGGSHWIAIHADDDTYMLRGSTYGRSHSRDELFDVLASREVAVVWVVPGHDEVLGFEAGTVRFDPAIGLRRERIQRISGVVLTLGLAAMSVYCFRRARPGG